MDQFKQLINQGSDLMTRFLQRNWPRMLVWLFFLIVSFAILWPFLLEPTFSLVDDGYSLTKGRLLISDFSLTNWSNTIIESQIGRIRPIYLLSFSLTYALFGLHPIGLWFIQSLILGMTLIVIYELLLLLTKSRPISLIAPLIWLAFPAVAENIFRTGTAEPKQTLFILVSLWLLLLFTVRGTRKLLVSSLVFGLLAIGTKETSVLIVSFFVLLLLKDKIAKIGIFRLLTLLALSVVILGAIVLVGFTFFFKSGYAVENFGFNLSDVIDRVYQNRFNFSHYYLLLWVGLISMAIRGLIVAGKGKITQFVQDNFISLSFLVLISSSILFVIAWAFQFERYMYLTWTFIIIFMTIEVSKWLQLTQKSALSKLLSARQQLFLTLLALFGFAFGLFILFEGRGLDYVTLAIRDRDVRQRSYDINQIEYQVIEKLIEDTQTEVLYVANDNYEVIYELGLYLSQLQQRKVTVVSPSLELSQNEVGYVFVQDPITAYYQDSNPKKALVARVADLKGRPLPANATVLEAETKHDLIPADQFWWIVQGIQ